MLEELHKVMGYANANVAMQFMEEDLHNIGTEVTATDKEIIRLGVVNPHVAIDIPHYAFAGASRKTLPLWALFLDSCATYHLMFIEWYSLCPEKKPDNYGQTAPGKETRRFLAISN